MDRYRIEINVSTVDKTPEGRLVNSRRLLTQQALVHADTDAEVLEMVGRYAENWAAGELIRLEQANSSAVPVTEMP